MKKIFAAFFICFLALPCYAVPNYDKAMEKIGGQTRFYDDSKSQKYYEKLNKEFFQKHSDGQISNMMYNREVIIHVLDFDAELQKQGAPGFARY